MKYQEKSKKSIKSREGFVLNPNTANYT